MSDRDVIAKALRRWPLPDDQVDVLADAIATALDAHRTITTREELEALPVGIDTILDRYDKELARINEKTPHPKMSDPIAVEALAPIRELHRPVVHPTYPDEPFCNSCAKEDTEMDLYRYSWPCPTARACYSTDEIQEMNR